MNAFETFATWKRQHLALQKTKTKHLHESYSSLFRTITALLFKKGGKVPNYSRRIT
jgi:hypothetical protein